MDYNSIWCIPCPSVNLTPRSLDTYDLPAIERAHCVPGVRWKLPQDEDAVWQNRSIFMSPRDTGRQHPCRTVQPTGLNDPVWLVVGLKIPETLNNVKPQCKSTSGRSVFALLKGTKVVSRSMCLSRKTAAMPAISAYKRWHVRSSIWILWPLEHSLPPRPWRCKEYCMR